MKLRTLVILMAAIQVVTTSNVFAQIEDYDYGTFQNKIEELLIEKNVPAIGIGIIEDGVLRRIQVYGNLKSNSPAPYNSIFNIASLSKPISTLMTLRLVSDGDWDLDEPLCHYWVDPDVEDDEFHQNSPHDMC